MSYDIGDFLARCRDHLLKLWIKRFDEGLKAGFLRFKIGDEVSQHMPLLIRKGKLRQQTKKIICAVVFRHQLINVYLFPKKLYLDDQICLYNLQIMSKTD